ncbi:MAG: CDP-diacylglycerol--glycerol-3-phosphate 3-phosphatidyltransferase [Eubacteriales bacterium]
MKMNLPNKLTVLRLFMVPVIIIVMLIPINETASRLLAAAVFGLTSLTDMLDGKIARKRGLITDFGKFLDPLADKFMVIAAMLVLLLKYDGVIRYFCFAANMIVIMRELAVTSIRLVASSKGGIVVAANMLGKIKTCTQIAFVLCALLEPVLFETILGVTDYHILTYISMFLCSLFTVWSGINYLKAYWKFLDPNK